MFTFMKTRLKGKGIRETTKEAKTKDNVNDKQSKRIN